MRVPPGVDAPAGLSNSSSASASMLKICASDMLPGACGGRQDEVPFARGDDGVAAWSALGFRGGEPCAVPPPFQLTFHCSPSGFEMMTKRLAWGTASPAAMPRVAP